MWSVHSFYVDIQLIYTIAQTIRDVSNFFSSVSYDLRIT